MQKKKPKNILPKNFPDRKLLGGEQKLNHFFQIRFLSRRFASSNESKVGKELGQKKT